MLCLQKLCHISEHNLVLFYFLDHTYDPKKSHWSCNHCKVSTQSNTPNLYEELAWHFSLCYLRTGVKRAITYVRFASAGNNFIQRHLFTHIFLLLFELLVDVPLNGVHFLKGPLLRSLFPLPMSELDFRAICG